MSVNNPAAGQKKRDPVPHWVRLPSGQRFDILLPVTAGLLILGLCLYLAWVWKSNHPSISFSPKDVVYGVPLHAQHEMDDPSGQLNSITPPSGNVGYPQIQISENFYDFGEINSSQVVSRTFVIANKGSVLLNISKAYTTCGCTTADFTASEIPPGKVVLMTLQLDAGYHNVSGYTVRRGVLIETNDPNHPTQEIWIQASVK